MTREAKAEARPGRGAAWSLDDVRGALPEATGALVGRVATEAASQGTRIHLVGGPVRDLILGRPLVDVDLVVEGDARQLAEAIAERSATGDVEVVAHDRFGTVRLQGEAAHVDLASLRSETYAHPGALPTVAAGDFAQDARRRDFSINALYWPLAGDDPTRRVPVLDPEGGLEDLAAGRLRILHPRSFHDDPTRAWRAARFVARLGVKLDRGSRAALRSALRDGAFGAVSGERYRREWQHSVAESHHGAHVGQVLSRLGEWHVLGALEPGLVLERECVAPLRRLSRVIAEPAWPTARWRGWEAALAIWLAPLPASLRRRTLDRFAVRGEAAKRIAGFGRIADRTLKQLGKARGRGAVDGLLAPLPEESVQALYALAPVSVRRRMLRWGAEDRRRRPPVNGADLVELGLAGPEVGRALARIRAGFLDGEIVNREEALALAEEIARRARRRAKAPARRRPRAARRKSTAAAKRGAKTSEQVAPGASIADTPSDVDGGSARSSD